MRTGLLVSAALATALVSSTALADRNNDYDNKTSSHSRDVKERVLESSKEGRAAKVVTESTRSSSTPNVIQQKTDHRSHGDMYDQYGKHDGKTSSTVNATRGVASKAGVPAMLQKKNNEEMANDNKSAKNSSEAYSSQTKGATAISSETSMPNYGPMGKQIGWTATGKTVRSFTHFVNDKGQINNNPHGGTATAMHARHQMQTILSACLPPVFKLFSWEGSGGDASEDAAP